MSLTKELFDQSAKVYKLSCKIRQNHQKNSLLQFYYYIVIP